MDSDLVVHCYIHFRRLECVREPCRTSGSGAMSSCSCNLSSRCCVAVAVTCRCSWLLLQAHDSWTGAFDSDGKGFESSTRTCKTAAHILYNSSNHLTASERLLDSPSIVSKTWSRSIGPPSNTVVLQHRDIFIYSRRVGDWHVPWRESTPSV